MRQDVLHSARVPLAMEALHGLVEPGGAWGHQPESLHNAVRHGEYRRHEDEKVQGPFIMPRREQGLDIGGTETRRA
jgi:hypothetical protein